MTCPNGHKADVERGDGAERIIWCALCGWRLVVKIHKTNRGWKHKQQRKD
jgi:hypothetical protein